jgi:hypothetical protein
MYVIVWEYHVRPRHAGAFIEAYSAEGAWARFFARGAGYRGTELLQDDTQPSRYLTLDRWDAPEAYAAFRAQWWAEYDALDDTFTPLMERETPLGTFTSPDPPAAADSPDEPLANR